MRGYHTSNYIVAGKIKMILEDTADMTGKAQSVPLVLLSITLKASGLKTRLSLGVCNILCYEFNAIAHGEYDRKSSKCACRVTVNHFESF